MKLSDNYLKSINFKERKTIGCYEYLAAPNCLIVIMLGISVDVIYVFTDENEIQDLLKTENKIDYVEIMALNKSAIKPFSTKEDLDALFAIIKRQVKSQEVEKFVNNKIESEK